MAQEIRTFTWCDVCLSEEHHEQGQPVALTASLPGSKPASLEADLCERHRKGVEELVAWLQDYGRKGGAPSAVKPQGGSFPCPTGCGYIGASTDLLDSHTRAQHGMTSAELEGTAATPCLAGCGRMFRNAAGQTQHMTRQHGWTTEQTQEARLAQVS